MTYVHEAIRLPLERNDYLNGLRRDHGLDTKNVPKEFEIEIEPILQVYNDIHDHCVNYKKNTHRMIVNSASSIANYSKNVEVDYSAICEVIKKMNASSSQEAPEGLHPLIDHNIKKITGFITDSRNANDKLNDFREETRNDLIAAENKTKELDSRVKVYEEDIKKESDSNEAAKRDIDMSSNPFMFLSRRAARKKEEASQSALNNLAKIKQHGDAMKTNLQNIRDQADTAYDAIEKLIGGLENVSKQLEDIKKIVNTNLLEAIAVDFQEKRLINGWKDVGKLATEFMADSHRP